MTDSSGVWTQKEVADFLRVSPDTVRRLGVPSVALVPEGGHGQGERPIVRYDEAEVRAWWAARVAQRAEVRAAKPAETPAPPRKRQRRGLGPIRLGAA